MVEMRKILHLIPTLGGGGAERQLAMLALEQSSRAYEVHIALRKCDGVYVNLLSNSRVKIHNLGDIKGLNPYLFFQVNKLIHDLRPHIVQTWLPQMDVLGGAAAILNQIPLVLTERASGLAYDGFGLLIWMRKFIGRFAQSIVANSESGAAYWRTTRSNSIYQKIIPNAVDVAAVQNALLDRSNLFDINGKFMLVVGRLSCEKSLDVIFRAIPLINNLQDMRFVILGSGPLREDLESLIKRLGIEDKVVMLPFQLNWWCMLRDAEAVISMSRYEGNPNVVLEAMAAGCRLIVSDIPAHREILTHDSANFVSCGNSIELAVTISELISNSNIRINMLSHVEQNLENRTIAKITDAYEDVYQKIAPLKVSD